MKKLLIVSPYYIPFAGVGANRMKSLINSIKMETSWEIYVIKNATQSYGNNIIEEHYPENVQVIDCEVTGVFWKDAISYINLIKEIFIKYKIDSTLITVGPFYTLPLVKFIKNKYNTPVILDVRDLWAHEPVTKDLQSGISHRIKAFLKDIFFERSAFRFASKIVVMGEADKQHLYKYYGKKINKKMHAIANGFDDTILNYNTPSVKEKKDNVVNLCVYGKFAEYISNERLDIFVDALREINNKVCLIQFGNEEHRLKDRLVANGVSYCCRGYMEYKRGINMLQKEADILLLSSDLEGVGLGTKVYDYIYCNRPIIYVGSKLTELSAFVGGFENGFACDSKDEIVKTLDYICSKDIVYLDNSIDIGVYSRSKHNKKYIELIRRELGE